MSTQKSNLKPVVVLHEDTRNSSRQIVRLVPAALVSIGAHAALLFLFFLFTAVTPTGATTDPANLDNMINAQPLEEAKASFSTIDEDPAALDPSVDTNFAGERLDTFSIPGDHDPAHKLGILGGDPKAPLKTIHAAQGYGSGGQGGMIDTILGKDGENRIGFPGGDNERGAPLLPGSPNGRSGASKEAALYSGGGTTKSEAAVAMGLKWLVRQQLPDGRWMLNSPNLADKDRGAEANDIAGTALGLLPLLAAGKTHKPEKGNEYDKVVDKGIKFLMRQQDQKSGYFGVSMYAHGLATIAMCEAYGLSQDPVLRKPAQSAVNLLINTQHENGGWRYGPTKTPQGDMSISGWQIMALKSAQMAGLDVPPVTMNRAKAFLNSCAAADEGYGYVGNGSSTPRMTAVGLLCRQYIENWGPAHPRMIKAIANHLKTNPPNKQDVYYYYYATQVMHHFGGEAWKEWNDNLRESLIKKQETNLTSPNNGSWSPAGDPWGKAGGRLMITSLNLLTLEVYYRYLPLYYRDAGYKKDDAVKKAF